MTILTHMLGPQLYSNSAAYRWATDRLFDALGYSQYSAKTKQNEIQIGYDQYMRQGYQRAYDDWQKNVGSKGRTIRYPELSYPGHINFYDKDVSSALLSNDIARSNFYGSLPFRGMGLYSIGSRASRFI